jgi:hypothetical protein
VIHQQDEALTYYTLQAQDEESEEDVRPRQRNRVDSEDENEQEPSDAEMDGDQHHTQSADDQLVKKLVRYVISCEYSRTAIRRDGIKERGNNGNHGITGQS